VHRTYEVQAKGAAMVPPPQRVRWPFKAMAVGEFFIVPEARRHNSCRSSATQYAIRHDWEISCLLGEYNELIVIRVR
jgi:hypothetical protein